MALDGCGQLCKYVLIIFNIFFAVVGFAMLALGLWLRFSNDTRGFFEIDMLNTSAFVIGVTVLISLGSVMLVVVAFGDFGACNENRCALQVFAVLLGVMAGIEVALGVLAYSRSDEVGAQLSEFYSSMYTLYVANKDPASAVTLTLFHNAFHCCGVVGVMLDVVKQTCPKPSGIWETFTMPACPAVIASAFRSKAPVILAIFLVTGALLTVALICTLILNGKLRDSLSATQYIILSHSSPTVANDNNPQPLFLQQSTMVSTSTPYPSSSTTTTYDQPVVFAPLPTLVNPFRPEDDSTNVV